MKKVLLIMAAALLMMTQCRKPETPSADTIKMTVTVGPGAKTEITDEGRITWSEDDVLYVSDGTKWLGSLTLQSGVGSATGTFTGTIQGIGEGTTKCHFFYLGHDNGMTGATANTTTDVSISFASQDGTREGALKYHLGYGEADVTVSGSEATGAVRMKTEIAIAHLKLEMNGAAYTGPVTMDVSNTMTVSPDGTFSGSGNGIAIGNNGGTSGDRYVTLIPTEATNVSFSGFATGSMTFGHGIQANNLYGMAAGIEVSLTAAHGYVDLGLPSGLLWATCNLGSEHPYDYGKYYAWGEILPYYADGHSQDNPCYNWRSMTTGAGNTNISNGYTWKTYVQGGFDYFVEWYAKPYGDDKILTSAYDAAHANWGELWRMPTEADFSELLDNTTRTWKGANEEITIDGKPVSMQAAGCYFVSTAEGYTDRYIFFPAAGERTDTRFFWYGSDGNYWSSSLDESDWLDQPKGHCLSFGGSWAQVSATTRSEGFSVRPVW